jgi:hypothetical protein
VSDQLQYVTLTEWAEGKFKTTPSLWTLRQMARNDRFDPPAVKIGKEYHVHPQARVVAAAPKQPRRRSLVQRMQSA